MKKHPLHQRKKKNCKNPLQITTRHVDQGHSTSSLATGENAPRHSQVASARSIPSGLQLEDSFRCRPLDTYHNFAILGDGIVEEIRMKKIHGGMKKGANLFLVGGFTSRQGC